ncbi:hypothetical protein [Methanocalculus sp.]
MEQNPEGRYVVVDYKTGSSLVSRRRVSLRTSS